MHKQIGWYHMESIAHYGDKRRRQKMPQNQQLMKDSDPGLAFSYSFLRRTRCLFYCNNCDL